MKVNINDLTLGAWMRIENPANTDFHGVAPRPPQKFSLVYGGLREAVFMARSIHRAKTAGENYICDIHIFEGKDTGVYHVSQNGRVWYGAAKHSGPDTKELMCDVVMTGTQPSVRFPTKEE